MNFAILTESKYFETTYLNVQQIRKFHPESTVVIGNFGLTRKEKYDIWEANNGCVFYDYNGNWFSDSEAHKMITKTVCAASFYTFPKYFMDADMVLMKPIDLNPKGDITVTIRESKYGKINSGFFIVYNGKVLYDWKEKALELLKNTGDRLSEQNALNWLYENSDYDFHEVPCDIYNYPKVEKGIPDDVVVVHLKSGRYKDPKMVEIVKEKIV